MNKRINLLLGFGLMFFLTSCMTSLVGNRYEYHYKSDSKDGSLSYEMNPLRILFDVGDKEINFTAINNSNEPVKILWDDAAIVLNGYTGRVMHKNVKFINSEQAQVPSVLPPHTTLTDLVLPIDSLTYNTGTKYSSGGWESKPLFAIYDHNLNSRKATIQANVGKTLGLFLPVVENGQQHNYTFNFTIDGVECVTCKKAPVKKTADSNKKSKKK